jgi:hypothetical protein
MKITLKINSNYKYLQFWNSVFNLTSKELQILAKFMDINKGVNLCSHDNKVKIAKQLKIDDPNKLNNYVKRFKDKGAIKLTNNGNYVLHKILKKQDSLSVKVVWDTK